jgi:glycine cleavage system aminomethyltransferase T
MAAQPQAQRAQAPGDGGAFSRLDTDGTTSPDDVGWGGVARRKQADFIGKRSLARPENLRPDRLPLVGLVSGDRPCSSECARRRQS